MEQWNPNLVSVLTELAAASNPEEVEGKRRELEHALREKYPSVAPLVDAVAERALRCSELERLASEDSVTGLANRRAFSAAVRRELARRRRGLGPCLVLLDLDGLKEINDRFGHAAGDEAIRLTARACVASVRGGDLVARLGGDELAVLLPDTDLGGAKVVAERIRNAIEAEEVRGKPLRVSLGVAIAGPDGDDAAAILELADARMYDDKNRRRHGLRLVA